MQILNCAVLGDLRLELHGSLNAGRFGQRGIDRLRLPDQVSLLDVATDANRAWAASASAWAEGRRCGGGKATDDATKYATGGSARDATRDAANDTSGDRRVFFDDHLHFFGHALRRDQLVHHHLLRLNLHNFNSLGRRRWRRWRRRRRRRQHGRQLCLWQSVEINQRDDDEDRDRNSLDCERQKDCIGPFCLTYAVYESLLEHSCLFDSARRAFLAGRFNIQVLRHGCRLHHCTLQQALRPNHQSALQDIRFPTTSCTKIVYCAQKGYLAALTLPEGCDADCRDAALGADRGATGVAVAFLASAQLCQKRTIGLATKTEE